MNECGYHPCLNSSDRQATNLSLREEFEIAVGKSFTESAKALFASRGHGGFDGETFEIVLNRHLERFQTLACIGGPDLSEYSPNGLKVLFHDTVSKACTETALERSRDNLLGWVNRIEKGKALLVDSLMGIGKTYSIVKVLGQNPDLSAVIFMPTVRLCQQMVQALKSEIVDNNPTIRHNYENITEIEEAVDEDGNIITDDIAGAPFEIFTREFLEREAYFVDGINKRECPYYAEIIERYHKNWISKHDICKECKNKKGCRFVLHPVKAPLSRVIVTTHHQYDRFCQDTRFHKWFKDEYGKKNEATTRDVFIVDEDLILSQCYQPIGIDGQDIGHFTAILIEFLPAALEDDQKNTAIRALQTMLLLRTIQADEDVQTLQATQALQEIGNLNLIRETQLPEIENKIHRLFSQTNMPEKTSVIPPVDPDFSFPNEIKKRWSQILPDQLAIVPDYLEQSEAVANYLEMIESGLRYGLVVQKFNGRDRVYFANRKSYDLSNLPPHVFFDGTKIPDKLLEKKLRGVKLEHTVIDVKPLWRLRAFQNVNTDLPRRLLQKHEPNVKQFVHDLVHQLGANRRYFFLTKKALRTGYLEAFLKTLQYEVPEFNYVLGHFGYLRGINDANECDIGVMLGSYNPSDAVEIAMALEFIQDKLPNKITATENNLWKWKDRNSVRRYESDYSDVQHLADALRHNEHRQGIARTRYLFHDVDFYVVSKDPVADYEPFLSKTETDQYRADIFPPRSRRPDSKYEQVKEAVLDWLKEHDSTTVTEVSRQMTGISRRHTVKDHLDEMCREGLLRRDGKKYKLPSDS